MSQGQPWIDRVMTPLGLWGDSKLPTHDYNCIYEAVGRGSEEQGKQLVATIVRIVRRPATEEPRSE